MGTPDRTDEPSREASALNLGNLDGDSDDCGFALGVEAAHPYLWTVGAGAAVGAPSCSATAAAR
jgi:hypothetical protein